MLLLVTALLGVAAQASPSTPSPNTPPILYDGALYFPSAEAVGSSPATLRGTLRYRLSQEIPLGGAVRLALGYPWEGRGLTVLRGLAWFPFQIEEPAAFDYVRVEVPGNPHHLVVNPQAGQLWPNTFTVEVHPTSTSQPLAVGQEIVFHIGDGSGGSPGYRLSGVSSDVHLLVEERARTLDPFELRYSGGQFPRIEIGPTSTDRFQIHVDSVTGPGEATRIVIQARQGADSFWTNSGIDRTFLGTVRLSAEPALPDLPDQLQFRAADRGVVTLQVRPEQLGVFRVSAADSANPSIRGESNPCLVRDPGPAGTPQRLLWGNLHVHSSVGGHALGNPEQAFTWAREVEALDFMGLSEHCSMPTGNDFDWSALRELDEAQSKPGRFVAFVGYEWTSDRAGHRNVIVKRGREVRKVHCLGDGNRTRRLLEAMEGHAAIGIPHHSAWSATGPMDWGDDLEHPNQPLVEIYSWHGSSEDFGNPLPMQKIPIKNHPPGVGAYVQEALAAGYRLGFTADSDNHLARPGSNIAFPFRYSRMGLTGVWTSSCTRDAIWHGLNARRTIATTGARAIGSFSINGHPVGDELWSSVAPELNIVIFGTDEIVELTVFRDGLDPVLELQPHERDIRVAWTDPNTLPGSMHSYYIRAIQADGHRIWLSPIWVRRTMNGE